MSRAEKPNVYEVGETTKGENVRKVELGDPAPKTECRNSCYDRSCLNQLGGAFFFFSFCSQSFSLGSSLLQPEFQLGSIHRRQKTRERGSMLAKTGTRCDAEIVGLPLFGARRGLSTLIDQSNQTGIRPAEGPWRLEGV